VRHSAELFRIFALLPHLLLLQRLALRSQTDCSQAKLEARQVPFLAAPIRESLRGRQCPATAAQQHVLPHSRNLGRRKVTLRAPAGPPRSAGLQVPDGGRRVTIMVGFSPGPRRHLHRQHRRSERRAAGQAPGAGATSPGAAAALPAGPAPAINSR